MEDERKQAQQYKDQVGGKEAGMRTARLRPPCSRLLLFPSAGGKGQREGEAAEASAGGGGGGGAAGGCRSQEAAEGAGGGERGQRRAEQGGGFPQEQTQVGQRGVAA